MIVNPTYEQLDNSDFDLLVSGSKDGVVMIEAEGKEIDEDLMYKAIEKSQEINIDIMNNLDSFINKHGKDNVEFNYEFNESIYSELSSALKDQLKDVYKKDSTKSEKEDEIKEIINSYVESKNSEETYDNEIDQLKADVF